MSRSLNREEGLAALARRSNLVFGRETDNCPDGAPLLGREA